METNTTDNKHLHTKKTFWKDKKNIAIVVLSILLFVTIISYPTSDTSTNNLQNSNLTSTINELQSKLEEKQIEVTNLQNSNKSLTEEKEKLEDEKKELNSKLEDAQKNVSKNSTTTSSPTSSSSEKTSSKTTSSTSKNTTTSNNETSSSTKNNSEMVWVGETGTKYHTQSCRTLKGKGHQITLKQALAEGREPCKVCH